MPRVQLVTRGDDAGSSDSANRAIIETVQKGVLRNISVMVPGPAFADAVKLLARVPEACLGLHVTLNSEWDEPRWGPVLPPDRVPSLVDAQGCFLRTPMDFHERGASVEEMVAEVEAQLQRARAAGLPIAYIDEHMGIGWVGGLGKRLADLAAREGLRYLPGLTGLPWPKEASGDLAADLVAALEAAEPGTYLFVTHPTFDDDEMRRYHGMGSAPGEIGRQRDADRRALIDPRVRQACQDLDVALVRYSEIADA